MTFKILMISMTVSFLLILIVVIYIKFYWKADKKEIKYRDGESSDFDSENEISRSDENGNSQSSSERRISRSSAKNGSSHNSLKFSSEPFIPGVTQYPKYFPTSIGRSYTNLNSSGGGGSILNVDVKEVNQSWIEEGVDRSGIVIVFRYFYEDVKNCNYGVKLGTIDLVDGYYPLEDIPSCFIIRWKVKTVIVDGKAQIYPSETWYHDKERTCTDKEIDFSKFKIPIKDPESTMQIIFLFEFIDQ